MSDQPLFDKLLQLRLPAFREGLRQQQTNPKYTELSFEERLSLLVDQECTRRHDNRIRRNLRAAAFPFQAALEDLELTPERGLDRRQVLELGQCGWVSSHYNLIVLGPTGSGKSFLTCAYGTAAVRMGFSVRYFHTSRLLHALGLARQDGTYANLLRSLARTDLLVLDDWMRDSLTLSNAQDLLEILDDRFGHSSTLVAAQVPVSDWLLRIPDPTLADAILDRLVHNSFRLQLAGESQRKLRAVRSMPHT
jgi:DNA replication protein DnaC